MSITYEILGDSGRDNALLVRIESGTAVTRLLFDCGEGCLLGQSLHDLQAIDHLFFSHLHMDHVAGFDTFFRANYNRTARPNRIWGPDGTGRILQHRMQGYWWNLTGETRVAWRIADIWASAGKDPSLIQTRRFELHEAFAVAHDEGERPLSTPLLNEAAYTVEVVAMQHHGPSLAYIVREKPRVNVDTNRLQSLGLRPGAWLQTLKAPPTNATPDTQIEINGAFHSLADLRAALLVETPGDSIAYLTDFLLDDAAQARLAPVLRGCQTLVCESQYTTADVELATRNHHMTSTQAATLARSASAGELILFHVSDRYTRDGWHGLLLEAQAIFPRTHFSAHWTR